MLLDPLRRVLNLFRRDGGLGLASWFRHDDAGLASRLPGPPGVFKTPLAPVACARLQLAGTRAGTCLLRQPTLWLHCFFLFSLFRGWGHYC